MLRWSISLAALLGFLALTLGGSYWLSNYTRHKSEDVRLSRSRYQELEQQLSLLQSPSITPLLDTLQEDMDALQIRLVEVMTQKPFPAGVLQIEYEQAVLQHQLGQERVDSVSVLRLTMNLAILHAMGLLEMFDRIDRSIGLWPYETRACELHRSMSQTLSAQCVIDFYHWDEEVEVDQDVVLTRPILPEQQLRLST